MNPASAARNGLIALATAIASASASNLIAQQGSPATSTRPMTFLDMQTMRQAGGLSPSRDGRWVLYTISTPDWTTQRRQSDLYLVSVAAGLPSTKQLTFTKEKNETSPTWLPDNASFLFLSNREAPASASSQNQLYLMRIDGGEARRLTDAKEGVSNYALSKDGRQLVYRAGKSDEMQLYSMPVAQLDSATPKQITRHPTGVGSWEFAPDGKRIYFTTADTVDKDQKERVEKKFTVEVRNMETPRASLWALELDSLKTRRLTNDSSISIGGFTISDDSRWVGFSALPADRYRRNITEQFIHADLFLLDARTGAIERLTQNEEVREGGIRFSPDSRWVAFSAPDDLTRYSMRNDRVYIRRVDDRGGEFRKLGAKFDGDVSASFWSRDGKTIYFSEGIRATVQLMALDVASGEVRQVSSEKAVVNVSRDDDSGLLLVTYSDPRTPTTHFAVANPEDVAKRSTWRRLTNANPEVGALSLGEEEEISWKSADGRMVGGVLVKPVGYRAGVRYPLIVAIHGGPASADVLGFNGGYGSQVYAGAGYMVLKPNYRGSTNYGEAHKTDIVGNYFQKGYEDIMTGVDHLIAQGLVDSTRMGVLGWSAGGHWSNWILTHTDRFKAISSGAGTSNWISMYAQSDVQRNRQFYLGNKLPYDDFDAYWNQSPIKYIRNARTPTMIHVVDGDPRVPRPQSEELHMALRQLGVPTELYVYPGSSHGIPDARNRLVKSVSEMAWMDYWVRGSGKQFAWRDVLRTLESDSANSVKLAGEKRP